MRFNARARLCQWCGADFNQAKRSAINPGVCETCHGQGKSASTPPTIEALCLVTREREAQIQKWGGTFGTWREPPSGRLAILIEEIGEVARAIVEREGAERLESELVQVAALAVQWIEALRTESGRFGTVVPGIDFAHLEPRKGQPAIQCVSLNHQPTAPDKDLWTCVCGRTVCAECEGCASDGEAGNRCDECWTEHDATGKWPPAILIDAATVLGAYGHDELAAQVAAVEAMPDEPSPPDPPGSAQPCDTCGRVHCWKAKRAP